MTALYPKRLIEVDLPIARISAHSRREKSIRHGHISTLHIWWARRPLAACRAVILASLWPDPVDLAEWQAEADASDEIRAPRNEELGQGEGVAIRPHRFLGEARAQMKRWASKYLAKASAESYPNLIKIQQGEGALEDPEFLRAVLLDFIADFANWDNASDVDYLSTSRSLVQAAHEALGGEPGTRPMVIDPFAGGGSIPLEALRTGADTFASDLNPIPVLLNKVVLEYIPKYGQRLADEVRKWGQWIREQAENELSQFYPSDQSTSTPIAYIRARTILSEAPGQRTLPVEVPLMRSMWLANKKGRKIALRWTRDGSGKVKTKIVEVTYFIDGEPTEVRVRRPLLEIFEPVRDSEVEAGPVARGHATCPVTGYTTKVKSVRSQLMQRQGGSRDSRLLAVASVHATKKGRTYRLPQRSDEHAVAMAGAKLAAMESEAVGALSLVPDESFTGLEPRRIPVPQYGIARFRDLFTDRQLLALTVLRQLIDQAHARLCAREDAELATAVKIWLAMTFSRLTDLNNAMTNWVANVECPKHLFGRQAIPMVWDFAEANPLAESSGSWASMVERTAYSTEGSLYTAPGFATAAQESATAHSLPDDSVHAMVTDPPYYYSVPYSDLSDFFYVWLRRVLGDELPDLFSSALTPKDQECVQNLPHSEVSHLQKSKAFFEETMTVSLSEGRRTVRPDGLGVVVFAHSDTEAWESLLGALIDGGWCVTGSWPIDTEMQSRVIANRQSTLASSVHICCRPREDASGELVTSSIGEWREVIAELPERLREWMPRLADEGVVGADAIFACLGPALEIFSRYSRVERASGETVPLREYLQHVWAAVSNEALSMMFKDADAASLEPDARLTAMWLWTLGAGTNIKALSQGGVDDAASVDDPGVEDEQAAAAARIGFFLEFDAARKIAQGLGVHLEKSTSIVEVKGDKARLLPVAERVRYLFGKEAMEDSVDRRRRKKNEQRSLFEELEAIEADVESVGNGRFGGLDTAKPGVTVLDKVHQSMVFFASGRGEALRRFLVDDGIGKDGRYWKLAQALSALYPSGTDEKRWVDGVLARKKGLGL